MAPISQALIPSRGSLSISLTVTNARRRATFHRPPETTAGCAVVEVEGAFIIGTLAAVVYMASSHLLKMLKIDDMVSGVAFDTDGRPVLVAWPNVCCFRSLLHEHRGHTRGHESFL